MTNSNSSQEIEYASNSNNTTKLQGVASKLANTQVRHFGDEDVLYLNTSLGTNASRVKGTDKWNYQNFQLSMKNSVAKAWKEQIEGGDIVTIEGTPFNKRVEKDGQTKWYHQIVVHTFQKHARTLKGDQKLNGEQFNNGKEPTAAELAKAELAKRNQAKTKDMTELSNEELEAMMRGESVSA